MVMTDGGARRAEGRPAEQGEEAMLTTGQAADVIGYGTTRKQVIAMVANNEIAHTRRGPGSWARIPLWAALTERRRVEAELAESKAEAIRLREQREQDRQREPE